MLVGALTFAAFAFIPVAFADGGDGGCANYTGILQALNASGLGGFANATESLNGTSGQYVLTELFQGNNTIFAPTNNAWSSVNPATTSNETTLADLIAYHIVSGDFINETQTYPNVTIGRTLLNASDLVMLEGNQSQVLVWSKLDNGSFFVMNQRSNITVLNTTFYNDSAILTIDSVLTIPPNISTVLNNGTYDLTSVAALLQSTALSNGPSLLDALSSAHGITLFAPNNAGVQAAQSSLAGLSQNVTALLNVASNHVINGTSVYSTEISNETSYVSAGGQRYSFVSNSTGSYVSVGGSNQVQIVEPNVLTSNGVIHIVNGVMLDTNSDPALASSAYASATSVAAHVAETGGPVVATFTSTPTESTSESTTTSTPTTSTTSTSTSTSTSTPTPTSAGAVSGGADNWKLGMLAGMIVGLGQII